MSLRSLLALTIFLATAILTSAAYAKDYAIEVIIFINKDGLHQIAEQYSKNNIIPAQSHGIRLDSSNNSTQWQPLPEEEYILQGVANKLKRSGRYKILKHLAWRQPVVDENEAQPIYIAAGRDFSDAFPERAYQQVKFSDSSTASNQPVNNKVLELVGTLNVVITRYLHIYSDLVYRLPRTNPSPLNEALNRDKVLVDYAVKSHRRMRSGKLHYIDHPIVGILVEATPLEDDE